MANKEQRGNKEKRKPKKEKPKAGPQISPFAAANPKSSAGKKRAVKPTKASLACRKCARDAHAGRYGSTRLRTDLGLSVQGL
jgi:hypothetical protein